MLPSSAHTDFHARAFTVLVWVVTVLNRFMVASSDCNVDDLYLSRSNTWWLSMRIRSLPSKSSLRQVLPWCNYNIIGHGTSWLHTSLRSLRFLHHLGPAVLGSVNRIETCTSVCNLYICTASGFSCIWGSLRLAPNYSWWVVQPAWSLPIKSISNLIFLQPQLFSGIIVFFLNKLYLYLTTKYNAWQTRAQSLEHVCTAHIVVQHSFIT